MALYFVTIFLSAFLLFQVQPLMAKQILPWYGGGPGVWTACMLFYQVFLLVGYAYAHGLSDRLPSRRQAALHCGLILFSLAFVSIAPGPEWRPSGMGSPTLRILALLVVHIGVPFATLAATTPLLTRWFHLSWPDRSPFRLYALSNAGSLLALLSYPFLVDPTMRLGAQIRTWSIGYLVFAALCVGSAVTLFRKAPTAGSTDIATTAEGSMEPRASRSDTILWMMLAATGSALLLAATNQICQDLSVVPLLWVLPLAIYLVSFIVCFDHERWYRRGIFMPLLGISSVGVAWVVNSDAIDWINIGLYVISLYAGTMVCHGELYRAKPSARDLTRFYLAVAAGGALGGVFVGVIAPRVFPSYWEYPISLVATGFLALACVLGWRLRPPAGAMPRLGWMAALLVLVGVAAALAWREAELFSNSVVTSRTFFGVNRVTTAESPTGPTKNLWHGRILHGSQFTDPSKRREPTSYFGRNSGVGIAMARYRALTAGSKRGLRVGVVGLGTGTLATYGRAGDVFRFYEIDTEVERMAREYFTYLEDSEAAIEIVLGDARLTLEREAPTEEEKFDLLIMDSFSGDAVPVHLLTREVYQIYLDHLRPEGVLVFQASNRYLNLSQVIRGLAGEVGQQAVRVMTTGDSYRATTGAVYVLATNNRRFLEDKIVQAAITPWSSEDPSPLVWTDDSASIWSVMTNRQPSNPWDTAPNLGHFVLDRGDVFSDTEEVQITAICRGLYGDSDGASAVIVVSAEEMRAGGAAPGPFKEFIERLYEKLGLEAPAIERGVLVFVSKKDRRAGIHLGEKWPNGVRWRAEKLFRDTAIVGMSREQDAHGISEFVRSLDRLIREDLFLR